MNKGLALLLVFLSGCSLPFISGYGERGQTREAFIRYVESVFKFQNQMTSQVMMLEDREDYDEILAAEQDMHKICEPLNEYAIKESEGLSAGLLLRRRVEKSAVACEKAAQRVDAYFKTSDD